MAKLTKEDVKRICERRAAGSTIQALAEAYDVDTATVRYHLKKHKVKAPAQLAPPSPGDEMVLEGASEVTPEAMMRQYNLDPDRWVPTRFSVSVSRYGPRANLGCKRIMTDTIESMILKFVRENVRPLPKPKLGRIRRSRGKELAVVGFWDLHVGAYAWNQETGSDWDVDIACKRAANAIDDVCAELTLYEVDKIVMPVGNDYFHMDSARMQTTHGEHYLDCDTRFGRVYLAGLKLMSYIVERAAELCPRVELLYIAGNHDTSTGFTLCAALNERYRNDPRINVDLRASPRKYLAYGGTVLGFDHGKIPLNQLKMIFDNEAKQYISQSTYREIQVGHTHQRRAQDVAALTPTNGLTVRTNPSLCDADYWHFGKGLIGEPMRSIEAWRYDKVGYRGSHVAWARGDEHPAARKIREDVK